MIVWDNLLKERNQLTNFIVLLQCRSVVFVCSDSCECGDMLRVNRVFQGDICII